MIDYLNSNSAAIQAVATVVLVGITTFYAIKTALMTRLMSSQREDGLLPMVVSNGFVMRQGSDKTKFCVECKLQNVGNGLALTIFVEFRDLETKKVVMQSRHYIDWLEKNSQEPVHIHISAEDLNNLRYEEVRSGQMEAGLLGVIKFHSIRNKHYSTQQMFALDKSSMKIKPVVGSFKFNDTSV